mmetsp:Transcript_37876/g.100874  ORF Transcript_37876/g.100874 Transcript_37876/m.100874 type:complete len:321 (-) Transcript_37876:1977-2939(-)
MRLQNLLGFFSIRRCLGGKIEGFQLRLHIIQRSGVRSALFLCASTKPTKTTKTTKPAAKRILCKHLFLPRPAECTIIGREKLIGICASPEKRTQHIRMHRFQGNLNRLLVGVRTDGRANLHTGKKKFHHLNVTLTHGQDQRSLDIRTHAVQGLVLEKDLHAIGLAKTGGIVKCTELLHVKLPHVGTLRENEAQHIGVPIVTCQRRQGLFLTWNSAVHIRQNLVNISTSIEQHFHNINMAKERGVHQRSHFLVIVLSVEVELVKKTLFLQDCTLLRRIPGSLPIQRMQGSEVSTRPLRLPQILQILVLLDLHLRQAALLLL